MNESGIVKFFNNFREILDAAQTPFSKLVTIILPIMSPLVPASFTAIHIYELVMDLFKVDPWVGVVLATLVGSVLELLGFVGAISLVHSVFRLARNNKPENWLPVILTGFAYFFYLLAMFLVNVQLGKYFNTPPIVNNIVGLLSFITVPTGLLAANELGQKSEEEIESILRKERRDERLEKYRIKHGKNVESFQKVSNQEESFQEGSRKMESWRKVKGKLSRKQMEGLANLSPEQMRQYASETGFTYKTISNWRSNARMELGLEGENREKNS